MPQNSRPRKPISHIFCSACGVKNNLHAPFCSACGAQLFHQHNAPTTPLAQPNPLNKHNAPTTPLAQPFSLRRGTGTSNLDKTWHWFRTQHVVGQVIGWLILWWVLIPVLIWRTSWNEKTKLALSVPFAVIALSVLTNMSVTKQPNIDAQGVVAAPAAKSGQAALSTPSQVLPTGSSSNAATTSDDATALLPAATQETPVQATAVAPTEVQATVEALTPTPVPPTATPLIPIARVKTNGNVRSYPSTTSGAIITTIPAGAPVDLVSQTPNGDWYEITSSGGVK